VSSISRARAAVDRFAVAAGVAGEQFEDVRLCVSEAVSNAVVHAYPNGEAGSVRVGAVAIEGELLIHVVDDGRGFHGATPSPGLGLGLPLMAKLSDGLVVRERSSGGVEVHLRFDLEEKAARGVQPPCLSWRRASASLRRLGFRR
jgi:anti-sigma regulatory factor (Ser/Thr protein kinase)